MYLARIAIIALEYTIAGSGTVKTYLSISDVQRIMRVMCSEGYRESGKLNIVMGGISEITDARRINWSEDAVWTFSPLGGRVDGVVERQASVPSAQLKRSK